MNLIKHLALASLVAIAPTLALAQAPAAAPATAPATGTTAPTKGEMGKGEHRGHRGDRMKAADKNGDGAISKAEADAAGMKRLSANFDKLDTNKDGKLTRDEMKAGRTAHHAERKGAPAAGATATPPAAPATK